MLLALTLTLTVVGCGKKKENGSSDNNTNQTQDQTDADSTDNDNTDADADKDQTDDKTDADQTDDKTDADQTVDVENPIDLLNAVWSQYAEEDRFATAGGDFNEENAVMDEAGRFGLEDAEAMDSVLGIPADCVELLDDAASLVHMMNANTFTAGAFHVTDAANVDQVVEGLQQNIMDRHWMCGMPEKLFIYKIDQYVVSFFGHDSTTSVFKGHLEATYPGAVLAFEGNIVDTFEE